MSRIRQRLESWCYAARHPLVKTATVGILLLLITVGVELGYWWPANHEQRTLITRIETQRRATVDALHAGDVTRVYRAAKSAVGVLDQKLNASGGQSDLVKSLEKLAVTRHVKILSQAYEEGKAKSEHLPLYLDISLQASYVSLREFLVDIHTLSFWVEAQEMVIERSREHPGLIKANLRLLTYRKAASRKSGALS